MAIVIAVGFSAIGVLIDGLRGDNLTIVFSVFYFLGCVAAVLAVQHRALFTAVVQPPLILFLGVPIAYQLLVPENAGGLRTRVIDLVLPLVTRFPLMLLTAAVVLIIAGLRVFANKSVATSRAQHRRRSVTTRHREGPITTTGSRTTDSEHRRPPSGM